MPCCLSSRVGKSPILWPVKVKAEIQVKFRLNFATPSLIFKAQVSNRHQQIVRATKPESHVQDCAKSVSSTFDLFRHCEKESGLLQVWFSSFRLYDIASHTNVRGGSAAAPSFVCPRADGHFGDTEDCSKFYRCAHGKALAEFCPGGLFWNSGNNLDWSSSFPGISLFFPDFLLCFSRFFFQFSHCSAFSTLWNDSCG